MTLRVDVKGLETADRSNLREFAATAFLDLTPFWRELGAHLARRKRNRAGPSADDPDGSAEVFDLGRDSKLGRGGVFESSPDRLLFGSSIFYSAIIHQFGTKRLAGAPAHFRRRSADTE